MSTLTRTTLEAAHVDEAEALLRHGGAPATIRPTGSDDAFAFDAVLDSDGELTLGRYDLTGSWVLRAEPDRYVVTTSDRGAVRWENGAERGSLAAAPAQFGPGANAVHLDGAAQVFEFQFTPHALQRLAADAHGVEHVRLGSGSSAARSPAHANYWRAVMRYTRAVFESGLLRDEHVRAALKANLALTLVDGHRLVDEVREWRLTSAGARAAYQRAVAFIESEALRPVSGLDVARAAGLPFRLLEECFQTQTGASVAARIRAVRVEGAHTQLMRAEPTRAAAESIVRRWGFTSLVGFLSLHRRAYPGRPLPFERA